MVITRIKSGLGNQLFQYAWAEVSRYGRKLRFILI